MGSATKRSLVLALIVAALAQGCARRATVQLAVGVSMTALGAVDLAYEDSNANSELGQSMLGWLLVPGILLVLASATELIVVREPDEPPLGALDAAGVVVLVTSPKETAEALSLDAEIPPLVARRIITRRDGPDGVVRTADDDRYESADEVRAIAGVTRGVMQRLVQRARHFGYAR